MGVPLPSDNPDRDLYLQALADESKRWQQADRDLREDVDEVKCDIRRLDSKFDELKDSVASESALTRANTETAIGKAKFWIMTFLAIVASIGPEVVHYLKNLWMP